MHEKGRGGSKLPKVSLASVDKRRRGGGQEATLFCNVRGHGEKFLVKGTGPTKREGGAHLELKTDFGVHLSPEIREEKQVTLLATRRKCP